jgi:hypothetical protein
LFNITVESRVASDLCSNYDWRATVVAIVAACEADSHAGYGKRETLEVVHLVFHWSIVIGEATAGARCSVEGAQKRAAAWAIKIYRLK